MSTFKVKKRSDKKRLDFLAAQHYTRWVGYDQANGHTVWPVFGDNRDLRHEIDRAMALAEFRPSPPTKRIRR